VDAKYIRKKRGDGRGRKGGWWGAKMDGGEDSKKKNGIDKKHRKYVTVHKAKPSKGKQPRNLDFSEGLPPPCKRILI